MDMDEYQKLARSTAIYPTLFISLDKEKEVPFTYVVLGLAGETGEIVERFKKIIRDKEGKVDKEDLEAISKELGDLLWYIANLATELGLSLNKIAEDNLRKLFKRKEEGKIHGSGDDR